MFVLGYNYSSSNRKSDRGATGIAHGLSHRNGDSVTMSDHTPTQSQIKTIPLTHGKVAIVDASDYEWLSQWNWYTRLNGHKFYAERMVGGRKNQRQIYMHRLILNAPSGVQVDHIDGDGLNNTRANLRFATAQQNGWNRPAPRTNTSGYKGVHWVKKDKKWTATIRINGKTYGLGYHDSPEEAAHAYDRAARELHGEFAFCNFPIQGDE